MPLRKLAAALLLFKSMAGKRQIVNIRKYGSNETFTQITKKSNELKI